MKKYTLTTILFTAFVIIFQVYETKAAWGDYDPSFGFGGVSVDLVTGYYPEVTALQPDGKILVAGYRTSVYSGNVFFLRRYLSNGSRDTAFGANGEASGFDTSGFRSNSAGLNIAILPNGKIAVAGKANGFYAVWQVTASGRNDRNFGQNGLQVLTSYPVVNYLYETPVINIQSGKILLGIPKVSGNRIILLRLNSNGTNDDSFGFWGESLTNMDDSEGYGVIVELDGKITIGGTKYNEFGAKGLDRKLANGQTDLSFFPTYAYPDNAGQTRMGLVRLATREYVMRVVTMSVLQPELEKFSSSGVFQSTLELPEINANCPNVFTNQNDGKLLANFGGGALFRLNANLSIATVETYNCPNLSDVSYPKAAIQTDDKMIVVGQFSNNLILARILPN